MLKYVYMKGLSKDKLFFAMKNVSLCFICLLFFVTDAFATNNAPIFYEKSHMPKKEERSDNIDSPFVRYYEEEVRKSKSLANYHEENYLYSSGNYGVSYYDGVLTYVIKDFDGDEQPEMALFKIMTDSLDEFSTKEIRVEMIKLIEGNPYKVDEAVLVAEQFNAERIECNIAIKYVNETWRIFLNYFQEKVRDKAYMSNLQVVEFQDAFNVVASLSMMGTEDEPDETFDYQNQVIDSGIDLSDDSDLYKRCFINDDLNMIPIFTIKRVNEKIREGFIDDYFEQHGAEDENGDFRKLRYGYTQFLDRGTYRANRE